MHIKELEITNYGPFKGTHKISLEDDPSVIFVNGTYEENPLQSNRAGKSSFIEAILYLLFGKTRGDSKEIDWITYGEDEMYVKGVIISGGETIVIKRGRTSKNKPILEIKGLGGKKKEKEEELISRIGLSYEDFISTYFFKQHDIHNFMETKPTEKKRLLQKWFDLERWQMYENTAKIKMAKAKESVDGIKRSLEINQSQILDLENLEDEELLRKEIEQQEEILKRSKNALVELKIELSKCPDSSSLRTELSEFKHKLQLTELELSKIIKKMGDIDIKKEFAKRSKEDLEGLKSKINISSEAVQQIIKKAQELITPVKENLAKLSVTLSNKSSLLCQVKSFTGMCPVDCKPCDKGERIPNQVGELETEIQSLIKEQSDLEEKKTGLSTKINKLNSEYEEVVTTERKIQTLERDSSTEQYDELLESLNATFNTLEEKKTKLLEDISKKEKEAQSINPEHINELRYKVSLEEQLQETGSKQIDAIHTRLGELKVKKERKKSLEETIKSLNSDLEKSVDSYHHWVYICQILGKDGIPSILVENSLSYIEDFANLILKEISPNVQIEFKTLKEVSSKETHCSVCGNIYGKGNTCPTCGYGVRRNKMKDEINLLIYDNGRPLIFSQDSGGGNVLVSLAVRLALSNLLGKRKLTSQILVLDEVFGALDEINRDRVSKVVFNMLLKLCNFRQVFVISHTPIKDFSYKKIQIIRDGKFSKVST